MTILSYISEDLTTLAFQEPEFRKSKLEKIITDVDDPANFEVGEITEEEKTLLLDILNELLIKTEEDILKQGKKPEVKKPEAQKVESAKTKPASVEQKPETPKPAPPVGESEDEDVDLDELFNDIENEF